LARAPTRWLARVAHTEHVAPRSARPEAFWRVPVGQCHHATHNDCCARSGKAHLDPEIAGEKQPAHALTHGRSACLARVAQRMQSHASWPAHAPPRFRASRLHARARVSRAIKTSPRYARSCRTIGGPR